MLLVMDVGNTNIVIGVYQDEQLVHHWRISTDRNKTEDEYGALLRLFLADRAIELAKIEDVIISNVVPPLTLALERMVLKYFNKKPLVIGPGMRTGLNIKVDNPREVGADRIVNAVAGIEEYGYPLIIVDFGTATTFCLIDEKAQYLGGAICPGIDISMEALYSKAAKLPKIELAPPESVAGRNTIMAMQSGMYYGYISLVDGIVTRMKKVLKSEPTIVATGGFAKLISQESTTIDHVDPLLTLKGLRIISMRNRG